jgi:hypothetical protein
MPLQAKPELHKNLRVQLTGKQGPDISLIMWEFAQCDRDALTSDVAWDLMAHNAALYHLLAPIRKRIQSLANKSRRSGEAESVFQRRYSALVQRQFRKAATDPLFRSALTVWNETLVSLRPFLDRMLKHAGGPQSEGFPDLSKKQLEGVEYLLLFFHSLLAGSPVTVEPKQLLRVFASLHSERPGPKPDEPNRKAAERVLRIALQAKADGKQLTVSEIAELALPWYATAQASRKNEATRWARDILRSRGLRR